MLAELSIKNFAIIDTLTLSFDKGLTVLTGETGAGKSIIIDAIQLLVGGRGSAEFVRYGESRAEIEGLFLIGDIKEHPVIEKAAEFGIEIQDDGMIILRREISTNGKSVCRINGKLVTIAILREIGGALIDIHGQHEHQELLNADQHLALLDSFGGDKLVRSLEEYQEIFHKYEKAKRNLQSLTQNEQQMAHRLDLLTFQFEEIQNAQLELHEDRKLAEQKVKFANFEKVFNALHMTYNSLYGEQKALDWLGLSMNHIEDAAVFDPTLKSDSDSISNCYYLLEEISYKIRNQLENLEYDPEELNRIESRLNEINQLKRKYGQSVEEILEYAAKIEEEIETITNRDSHIQKLEAEVSSLESDLLIEAENLSTIRQDLANKLTNSIHQELKDLYMDKTKFEIVFKQENTSSVKKFKNVGIDEIEFYISTNPGEPLKPLTKVASGGELSRIMLALKSIFSKHQGVTSIIFDEVDTGVSGRVAQSIAEKISKVAIDSQVLCISHLPQVAALADHHLFISKETINERTKTHVSVLNDDEKIKEISRMIAGVEITELTKQHAKELLDQAKKVKQI